MAGSSCSGAKTCNADFFDALEVIEPAPGWRDRLLKQSDERDRRMEGMRDLYEQYAECMRSLQALRESVPGCGASPTSPRGAALAASGDSEPAPVAVSHEAAAALQQPEASRGEWVRCQELEALRHLLKEREEELSERDVAYAKVRYQNAELRAELKRTQDQLREATRHGALVQGEGAAAKQK